jgi:hypothetical protein
MTLTTIEVFQKAVDFGLKLGVEPPDTLTFEPVERCRKDFVPILKSHKPALLALLRLPFVMVLSETLGETIFFCDDEDTKAALLEVGASEWIIYTRDELRTLSEQNRIAPFSDAELRKLHEIRKTFHGRIARGDGG